MYKISKKYVVQFFAALSGKLLYFPSESAGMETTQRQTPLKYSMNVATAFTNTSWAFCYTKKVHAMEVFLSKYRETPLVPPPPPTHAIPINEQKQAEQLQK